VGSFDRSGGDEASSVSGLDAPRDDDFLGVTYDGVWTGLGRRPETEVADRIDIEILAIGRLVASGATVVGTGLTGFGVVGKTGGVVGGRVGLSVNGEKNGERDESEEAKTEG